MHKSHFCESLLWGHPLAISHRLLLRRSMDCEGVRYNVYAWVILPPCSCVCLCEFPVETSCPVQWRHFIHFSPRHFDLINGIIACLCVRENQLPSVSAISMDYLLSFEKDALIESRLDDSVSFTLFCAIRYLLTHPIPEAPSEQQFLRSCPCMYSLERKRKEIKFQI